MPPLHRSTDGMPTGAVLGFCNMLNKMVLHRLISGERVRLVMVSDCGGKNFRHSLYPAYKANRPPCPVDLSPQFPLVSRMASAYGVPRLSARNYEADDVIATLATRARERGVNVNVVSSDKDLMQLVVDSNEETSKGSVHMIDPMRQRRITEADVVERWGVVPSMLGDVLALAGDKADNIPGVRGIGPKIAAELVNGFGGLEAALDGADTIRQAKRREAMVGGREDAEMSRRLVELVRDVPLEDIEGMEGREVEELEMQPLDEERLLGFYGEMGFTDIGVRVGKMIESARRRGEGLDEDGQVAGVPNVPF